MIFILNNLLFSDECKEATAIGEVSEKSGEDKIIIARLVEKDKIIE